MSTKKSCDRCLGTGYDLDRCDNCGGTGAIDLITLWQYEPCTKCVDGLKTTNYKTDRKCHFCRGTGYYYAIERDGVVYFWFEHDNLASL